MSGVVKKQKVSHKKRILSKKAVTIFPSASIRPPMNRDLKNLLKFETHCSNCSNPETVDTFPIWNKELFKYDLKLFCKSCITRLETQ